MKYIIVIILILTAINLVSQQTDSLLIKAKTDSMAIDSILYKADNIYYNAQDTLLLLWDKAKIVYHNSSLKADTIQIDFNKKQAYTKGISVLKEGKQSLIGSDIKFDMEEKKGLIKKGESKFDKGYYYGEEIRKIDDNLYDVDNGIFTTCDAKSPHFFIRGKKVRIYFKDKVVMKPVVFYVNHFPVLALPFATFTLKRGRKTGILTPSPGYNKTDGKSLKNIAFYYAYKNYADFLLSGDIYEKTGWGIHFDTNYIKRYSYNGFSKIYLKKRIYSPIRSQLEWHISAKHHQDFKEKRIFDLNLDFISSKNILEGIDNVSDRLKKRITSKLSYKFPLLNRTLSIYSSYTHDILNDVRDITLPSISYNLPSKPFSELFSLEKKDNWLQNFSYSYSFKAIHHGKITDKNPSFAQIIYKSQKDTSGVFVSQHNAAIQNSASLRFDKKLWGWLNFSSSFSDKFAVFDKDKNDKRLPSGNSYNFSTGVKFSLYGIAKMPNFFVSGIRHIFTPSFSFNYHPDFSENQNLYHVQSISINSSDKTKNFTFSLFNKWQLKIKPTKKAKEKKLNDFLSIKSSLSYDAMKTDDKGFSKITHYIKLQTGKFKTSFFNFNFLPNLTVYQDPYLLKLNTNPKNWKAGISNWNFNTLFNLEFSSNAYYYDYFPVEKNIWDEKTIFDNKNENNQISNIIQKETKKWNLNFSLDYKTDKNSFEDKKFTSSFRTNFKFAPTKNWYIDYQNYYDVKTKKMISYTITITRNLHCWKIVFRYTKQSTYWSYSFRLFNIKLPDTLKFKTSDNKRY